MESVLGKNIPKSFKQRSETMRQFRIPSFFFTKEETNNVIL